MNEKFNYDTKESVKETEVNKKGSKGIKKGKGRWKQDNKGRRNFGRGKMFNDINYYLKNKTITESFAKLPFNYVLGNQFAQNVGVPITIGAITSFGVDYCVSTKDTAFKPSEILEEVIPNDLSKDILNQVATIIYTTMRRSNAGATNDIEPVDVITSNLLASVDILANAVSMRRTFKIANTFSWKNRLVPKILFDHLGLDYADFIANQAAYRGRFNTLVAKARTIRTLAGYPFINAFIAEFENIFKDCETDNGREQLWIPVKLFHHVYDPVGTEDHPGGTVRLITVKDVCGTGLDNPVVTKSKYTDGLTGSPSIGRKFSVDLNILEAQINALITDADFNVIQADIEKAFGEQSGYMVIDTVPEVESITPIYSGEFSAMVHNAKFLALPPTTSISGTPYALLSGADHMDRTLYVNSVWQQPGSVSTGSQLSNVLRIRYGKAWSNDFYRTDVLLGTFDFLDSESNDPSIEDVVTMTRYLSQFKKCTGDDTLGNIDSSYLDSDDDNEFKAVSASNLIVFGLVTTVIATSSDDAFYYSRTWNNISIPDVDNGTTIKPECMLFQYGVRPRFFTRTRTGGGSPSGRNIFVPMNDISNIRPIKEAELSGIHDACYLSLWDLPSKSTI